MKSTDEYRELVLQRIAAGKAYKKIGKVTYNIDGKLYHVKVKRGQLNKYPFNINNAVLAADFEVYVCATEELYYVIPVELVNKMHSDPSAMPDHRYPGLTILDVYPGEEKIRFGTGGKSLSIGKFRNTIA